MAERRIATTRVDDVKPLGDYGQRSFEFVTGVVSRRLTPRHAALFAEPEDTANGVAWKSEAPGPIRPLASMGGEEADALREAVAALVLDILALADEFATSQDPAAQSVAIALRNAVETPNEECVFAVGDQPVIVQWAHHLDVYDPPTGVLSRIVRPAAAAAAAAAAPASAAAAMEPDADIEPAVVHAAAPAGATAPARTRGGLLWWLCWLLLAILLIILAARAVPACAISSLWLWSECGRAGAAAPVDAAVPDRSAALEREIAELERQIADQERLCVASAPKPAPPPPPPPEKKPTPPPPPPKETIEDVIKDKDVAKLEGCWQLESDYTLYEDGDAKRPMPVNDWKMCFDAKGNGDQTVRFKRGEVCEGGVKASFDAAGKLAILDQGAVPCRRNGRKSLSITQRRTVCDVADQNRASCQSLSLNKGGSPVNVLLKRVR